MIAHLLLVSSLLGDAEVDEASWWESACDRERTTTAAERKAVRRRVIAACRDLGAKPDVCEMMDAVVMRESDGRADVKHTLGKGEYGIGVAGLSVKYHLAKWHPSAPQESLCIPEVSTVIVLRIWRGALAQYDGKFKLDLQRVFAGRWYDVGLPPVKKLDAAWCRRLSKRGQNCMDRVRMNDLGKGPKVQHQDEWLSEQLAAQQAL